MKRMTATEKWEDRWFSSLSLKHKVLWQYLCDRCDAAGVWEPNERLAEFQTGIRGINWDEVRQVFAEKVRVLRNGRWWLPSFVAFQYGPALLIEPEPKAKVLLAIVRLLEKHGLWQDYRQWAADKGDKQKQDVGSDTMAIPLLWDQRKEKDKDKDSVLVGPAFVLPQVLATEAFRAAWADWTAYRAERKLPAYKPKGAAAQFTRLAVMGHDAAIAAIRFSMAQNYQGIFPEGAGAGGSGKPGRRSSFA